MSDIDSQAKSAVRKIMEKRKASNLTGKSQLESSAGEDSDVVELNTDYVSMYKHAVSMSSLIGMMDTNNIRSIIYHTYYKYRSHTEQDKIEFFVKPLIDSLFKAFKLSCEEKDLILIGSCSRILFQVIHLFNEFQLHKTIIPGLDTLPVMNAIKASKDETIRKEFITNNCRQVMRFYIASFSAYHTKLYTEKMSKKLDEELSSTVLEYYKEYNLPVKEWKVIKKTTFNMMHNLGCIQNYDEIVVPMIDL